MSEFRWSAWAEVDLAEIALFIASNSPGAALRFYEDMEAGAERLAANPGLGRRHPKNFRKPCRRKFPGDGNFRSKIRLHLFGLE